MNEKLSDPKKTIEVIQKYQFAFQKRFGQNFLIDAHVLEKIVSAAGITKDDCVLEIGPGIGTMTQYLAESAGQVIAVEIDTNLLPILADTLKDYSNVKVINQDILKVDINELVKEYNNGRPIKVVANLPYYITTLLSWDCLKAMCQSTISRLWSRKKWQTVCRWDRDLRITAPVSGSAVLRKPIYCGKCAAKLLYPKTKCRFRGDPSDPLSGAAGTGKRSEADVQADSRIL